MESGNLLFVFLILTISTFSFVHSESQQNPQDLQIYNVSVQKYQPILFRSARQLRQSEEEEGDEESELLPNGTAPLIDVPALANYLSAAVKNASLANISKRIQNVTSQIFRPIALPIRGLTDLLGLSKPKAGVRKEESNFFQAFK